MAEHVSVKGVAARDTIQTRSSQSMKGLSVGELCTGKAMLSSGKMHAMSFLPLVTRFEMMQADTLCDVTSDSAWSERDIKQYIADRAYVDELKKDISETLCEDSSLLSMDDCCTSIEPMDLKDGIHSYIESNIEIPAEQPCEVKDTDSEQMGTLNPQSSNTIEAIFTPPFESTDYRQIPMPECVPPENNTSQLATIQKCLPQILKTSQSDQAMTVTVDRSSAQIIIHNQPTTWMGQGDKIAQPIPVSIKEEKVEAPPPKPSSTITKTLFSTAHLPGILPKTMEPVKVENGSKADNEFLQFVKDIQFTSLDSQGNETFKCTMCPKVYLSMNAFKAHASTHFKGTNTCGVCGKQFSRSWLLKGHMRTHTGERPFACTYEGCNKAFADRSNLRSHMLIHSAASGKGYRCGQCQRVFAQKRYLHKHMQEVCKVYIDDATTS